MTKPTVLIVEDDPGLRTGLRILFGRDHTVSDVADGQAALDRLRTPAPVDLVILDLMLPDFPGEKVLAEIRRTHPELPVLVLSARSQVRDKVDLLDAGADDYLAKPFANEELLARARVLLQRRTPPESRVLRCESVVVDLGRREITRDGEPIRLSKIQFAIVEALARRQGQALSRDQIIERVWGLDAPESPRVVDYHILQIRRKLEPVEFLVTVPGHGYRLADR